MKLQHFDLLSPEPFFINNVGHVKSPTLREISKISYFTYGQYLNGLSLTPEDYYNNFEINKIAWYKALDDDSKAKILIYDKVLLNQNLLYLFINIFDFFFVEKVIFNTIEETFCLYESEQAIKDKNAPLGIIYKDNFSDICNIILQRNYISRDYSNDDYKKAKNKHALEILKKLKKGQEKQNKKNHYDEKMELSNIISALSTYSNSLNILNIWDITVYQLYDQFKRQQNSNAYNIESMTVSVWGDKDNKFDMTKWYQTVD